MKKLVIVLFLFVFAAVSFAGPVKFKIEDYKDPVKAAKKLVKTDMKKIKKFGLKKVLILECYGQYVTSREITAGVAAQRSAARAAANAGQMFYSVKTKVDSIELDKDFYTNTSNRVFHAVKDMFEANGIEVVTITKDGIKTVINQDLNVRLVEQ